MRRACDPFSQTSIHIVVDGDCIWRVPLALRRGDDTAFDPVMNDPQADAVSRTHLADCKRSCGNRRCGDTMLVSKPTYHADREGLPSRTRQTLAVEPCDDLFVIISLRQGADFSDECFGITRRRTSIVSVAPPCQRICSQSNFGSGLLRTVISRISKRRMRLRSRAAVVEAVHSRGKSLASSRICRFWSAVTVRSR